MQYAPEFNNGLRGSALSVVGSSGNSVLSGLFWGVFIPLVYRCSLHLCFRPPSPLLPAVTITDSEFSLPYCVHFAAGHGLERGPRAGQEQSRHHSTY